MGDLLSVRVAGRPLLAESLPLWLLCSSVCFLHGHVSLCLLGSPLYRDEALAGETGVREQAQVCVLTSGLLRAFAPLISFPAWSCPQEEESGKDNEVK